MWKKKLLGGLVGVLFLLWLIQRFTSSSSSAPTVLGEGSSQSKPTDKWQISRGQSSMDDSKTVVLNLRADNDVQAWLEDKRPILNIRCKEGKTQVYLWTGTAATVEEIAGHTVRIRLDDGTPIGQTWGESTDHNSLFFDEDAIVFVKQLVKAKTLAFQFTPFSASPAVACFDLRGLENHIGEVAATCGWSVD